MTNASAYFLVSSARSGSTSLTTILDEASNGCCLSEPNPNLNVECRQHYEGNLANPDRVIEDNIVPRVRHHLARWRIYGEKNVTLGVFIPELYRALRCKFVFLKRDGRDVVRSLLDWHNKKFGSIYRECKDPGKLNDEARRACGSLPVHLDLSDYSRPRPLPNTELCDRWESLTRNEMCAWYWSTINQLMLKKLESLPADAWIPLDYTTSQADAVLKVARFCGLDGLSENRVQELLTRKINSLKDRDIQDSDVYPDWKNWDGGERRRFTNMAGEGMKRLGYFNGRSSDWRPNGFGKFWQTQSGDYDWYLWMHECRKAAHEDFFHWVDERNRCGDAIESIADFGCGLGIGYCERFAGMRFVGVELAQRNTEWCRANRTNPLHEFRTSDFMETPLDPKTDVVTSSGTIDNCYDIEAFLATMLASAKKWIYLTCYRGWFPELEEHRYTWNPDHGCFYNDVSARRVEEYLKSRGCSNVVVCPLRTGKSEIPYETRIIARVP